MGNASAPNVAAATRRQSRTARVARGACLIVLIAAAAAESGSAAPHVWNVVGTAGGGTPFAVTCPSPSLCWAVGAAGMDADFPEPYIERYWQGRWTAVGGLATEAGGSLSSIACVTAADCWAVGAPGLGAKTAQPIIEHLTGGGWSAVSAPNLGPAAGGNLAGIACLGAQDCWAVGTVGSGSGPLRPLIEHLTDGGWSVAAGVGAGSAAGLLYAVTCSGAAACWAVGEAGGGDGVLIERDDGNGWTVVSDGVARLPSGTPYISLESIACPTATDCWAVGLGGNGRADWGVIEHYAQGRWVADAAGGPLLAVACPADDDCWAAGYDGGHAGFATSVVEQFTGGAWTAVSGPAVDPGPGGRVFASGIACPSPEECWAIVGSVGTDI